MFSFAAEQIRIRTAIRRAFQTLNDMPGGPECKRYSPNSSGDLTSNMRAVIRNYWENYKLDQGTPREKNWPDRRRITAMEEMIDKVLAIHDDEQRRAVIMRGNKVTWTAIAKKLGCPSRKQREAKQLEADGINEILSAPSKTSIITR